MTVEQDRITARKNIDQVIAEGKPLVEEAYSGEPDISRRYFEVSHLPVKDAEGCVEGVIAISSDITDQKKTRQAMADNEALLKEAQRLGKTGNWVMDLKTGKVDWSDELYVLYERDKKDGPTTIYLDNSYFSPSESKKLEEYGRIVAEKGVELNYRIEVNLPSGKVAHFDDWMYPIKDDMGKVIKLAGTVQEITERIRIEETLRQNEQRLRSVMNASPVGISWMNMETREIEYINKRFTDMFGYVLEEIPTIDRWFELARSDGQPHPDMIEFNADPELKEPREIKVTCKSGEVRDVQIMTCLTGNFLVATFVDITDQKKAYKELSLRAEILDNANDCITIFDENRNYSYVNATVLKLHGYALDEYLKLGPERIIVPGYEARRPQIQESLHKTGEALFETAHYTRDGSILHLEIHARQIKLANKTYVLSIGRNINERKTAEKDLRIKADLLDNATDCIFVTDIKGKFLYANKTTINMFGYSGEELLESNVDLLSAESPQRNAEIKREANAAGTYSFEINYLRKDRSTFPAEVFARLIELEGTTYVLSISRDLTQRKQSEEDLQFQARILNSALDSIFVWDQDKKCVYVNDAGLKASGFTRAELIGKNLKQILPEDQYNHIAGKIDSDLFEKGSLVFEASELSRTGEVIPVEVHSHIIEIGNKKYSASISRNISERKRAEKELHLRAELLDSTNDSIIVWDNETGKFIYVNETACTCHGYTRKEFDDLEIEDIVVLEAKSKLLPRRHGIISPSREDIFETFHRRKDGSTFPIEIHARIIEIQGKTYVLSIGRDTSRRKEYEKNLKMRAELLDNSSDSVFVMDPNDRLVYFNEPTCQLYGYKKEELSGLSVYDLLAGTDAETLSHRNTTLSKGEDFFESVHRKKDGSTFPVEIRGKLFEMEGNKYILSICRDITQRKVQDEERKASERRLLSSMEATILALSKTVEMRDPYTSGHQLRATLLATAIATHLGYSEDKNRGLYLAGIVHDIGKIIIPAEILSKPGKLSEFEFDLIKMHPKAGYDMLKDIEFPWPIAQIVAQHHERINGSGYPLKLKDKDILPEAKILAVADVVEAIASHRPYRPAMGIDAALQEIETNSGIIYDADAVEACLYLFRNRQFQFE